MTPSNTNRDCHSTFFFSIQNLVDSFKKVQNANLFACPGHFQSKFDTWKIVFTLNAQTSGNDPYRGVVGVYLLILALRLKNLKIVQLIVYF